MIPLRDNVPNVNKPVGVWIILGLNVAVFIFQLTLSPQGLFNFAMDFGVVPARYLTHPRITVAHLFSGDALAVLTPLVSYMFLHGGWLHIILNMLVLIIFADNVEDVMGHGGFLIFYFLCGLAALAVHMAFNPDSMVPIIGASGAIAGVMGAYFLLYPHARVIILIPLFFIPYITEVPSVVFLGLWFAIQIFSGLAEQFSAQPGEVAFWAHVGGFVAGLVLMPLFRQKDRCVYCYDRSDKRYREQSGLSEQPGAGK